MTHHFPPLASETIRGPSMLIDAARCWRAARDSGRSVQPHLYQTLDGYDCAMLAPVLDSLCLFYEAALGRPMAVGATRAASDDEQMLLDLVDGSIPLRCLSCPQRMAANFSCVLCSTRIMLALTMGQPASRTVS